MMATVYYVDSVNGSDGNSGTNTSAPWRTLGKIINTAFSPGDQILFRKGRVWNGLLWPGGSGANGNPIRIDAYGTGNAPIINGGGNINGAVLLHNQQYWEIR